MTTLKDAAKYAGGFVLAALLFWWVLRGTEPAELAEQLRKASIPGLLLASLFNVSHLAFRAWRWRALLAPVRPGVAFRPMFSAIVVGYLTSWVVPGRLGELVRPMLLSSREGVPLGPSIGSIVADRLFDLLAVAVLFAIGAWITPLEGLAAEHAGLIRGLSLTMFGAVAGGMLFMWMATSSGRVVSDWVERRNRLVRWLGRAALSLSGGLSSIRSPRLMLIIVVNSLLAWTAITLAGWIGIRSSGADVTPGVVMVIMPMLVLGVAVPTPGGAGSYHGAMKASLMLFGISEVIAVSAGLLVHAMITIPFLVLGVALIWIEKISWRDLLDGARKLRQLGDARGTDGAEGVVEGASS